MAIAARLGKFTPKQIMGRIPAPYQIHASCVLALVFLGCIYFGLGSATQGPTWLFFVFAVSAGFALTFSRAGWPSRPPAAIASALGKWGQRREKIKQAPGGKPLWLATRVAFACIAVYFMTDTAGDLSRYVRWAMIVGFGSSFAVAGVEFGYWISSLVFTAAWALVWAVIGFDFIDPDSREAFTVAWNLGGIKLSWFWMFGAILVAPVSVGLSAGLGYGVRQYVQRRNRAEEKRKMEAKFAARRARMQNSRVGEQKVPLQDEATIAAAITSSVTEAGKAVPGQIAGKSGAVMSPEDFADREGADLLALQALLDPIDQLKDYAQKLRSILDMEKERGESVNSVGRKRFDRALMSMSDVLLATLADVVEPELVTLRNYRMKLGNEAMAVAQFGADASNAELAGFASVGDEVIDAEDQAQAAAILESLANPAPPTPSAGGSKTIVDDDDDEEVPVDGKKADESPAGEADAGLIADMVKQAAERAKSKNAVLEALGDGGTPSIPQSDAPGVGSSESGTPDGRDVSFDLKESAKKATPAGIASDEEEQNLKRDDANAMRETVKSGQPDGSAEPEEDTAPEVGEDVTKDQEAARSLAEAVNAQQGPRPEDPAKEKDIDVTGADDSAEIIRIVRSGKIARDAVIINDSRFSEDGLVALGIGAIMARRYSLRFQKQVEAHQAEIDMLAMIEEVDFDKDLLREIYDEVSESNWEFDPRILTALGVVEAPQDGRDEGTAPPPPPSAPTAPESSPPPAPSASDDKPAPAENGPAGNGGPASGDSSQAKVPVPGTSPVGKAPIAEDEGQPTRMPRRGSSPGESKDEASPVPSGDAKDAKTPFNVDDVVDEVAAIAAGVEAMSASKSENAPQSTEAPDPDDAAPAGEDPNFDEMQAAISILLGELDEALFEAVGDRFARLQDLVGVLGRKPAVVEKPFWRFDTARKARKVHLAALKAVKANDLAAAEKYAAMPGSFEGYEHAEFSHAKLVSWIEARKEEARKIQGLSQPDPLKLERNESARRLLLIRLEKISPEVVNIIDEKLVRQLKVLSNLISAYKALEPGAAASLREPLADAFYAVSLTVREASEAGRGFREYVNGTVEVMEHCKGMDPLEMVLQLASCPPQLDLGIDYLKLFAMKPTMTNEALAPRVVEEVSVLPASAPVVEAAEVVEKSVTAEPEGSGEGVAVWSEKRSYEEVAKLDYVAELGRVDVRWQGKFDSDYVVRQLLIEISEEIGDTSAAQRLLEVVKTSNGFDVKHYVKERNGPVIGHILVSYRNVSALQVAWYVSETQKTIWIQPKDSAWSGDFDPAKDLVLDGSLGLRKKIAQYLSSGTGDPQACLGVVFVSALITTDGKTSFEPFVAEYNGRVKILNYSEFKGIYGFMRDIRTMALSKNAAAIFGSDNVFMD